MLFKIGDRVVLIDKSEVEDPEDLSMLQDDYFAIGEDNIGTIVGIPERWENGGFYRIAWDKAGRQTYGVDGHMHQWNVLCDLVKLLGQVPDEWRSHPHWKVIRKVKRMEARRKELGYVF